MTTLSLRKAYPFSGESITSICMHCSNIFGVLWTQEAFDLFDQNYLGWGKRRSSIRGWWLEMAVSDRAAMKLSRPPLCTFLLVTAGKRIGFSAILQFPNWIFQLTFISGGVTFVKTKAV